MTNRSALLPPAVIEIVTGFALATTFVGLLLWSTTQPLGSSSI